jgi:hypothetical protein
VPVSVLVKVPEMVTDLPTTVGPLVIVTAVTAIKTP